MTAGAKGEQPSRVHSHAEAQRASRGSHRELSCGAKACGGFVSHETTGRHPLAAGGIPTVHGYFPSTGIRILANGSTG